MHTPRPASREGGLEVASGWDVEAIGRFVEKQVLRRVDDRAGERDFHPLTL